MALTSQIEKSDSRWRHLTVGHALSKTTGLCWPGPGERMPSDMSEVFKLQFSTDPGAEFAYKPDPQIIVYLLERIYEKGIVEIMQENLICKLGNDKWNWDRNRIEDIQLPIKILDRFGELYLQSGKIDELIIFEENYTQTSLENIQMVVFQNAYLMDMVGGLVLLMMWNIIWRLALENR